MSVLHTPFLSLLYSTVLASPPDLKESKNVSVWEEDPKGRVGENRGPGALRGGMGSPKGSVWGTVYWHAKDALRDEEREDKGIFSRGER